MVYQESKTVEFKEKYSKTLLKTVCAFANYSDGVIYIGITDEGKVVGVQDPKKTLMQIENAINESIEPRPDYEMELELVGELVVVAIRVMAGGDTPYIWNNKSYKRYDSSTVEVDRIELKRLILNGMNKSYEESDYNFDGTFLYLERKLKKHLALENMSRDILMTLGLLRQGQYNLAAALISDDNPVKYAFIEMIAYEDDTVMSIVDHISLREMSVLEQVDKCIDFYHKHINRLEKIQTFRRETIEEVPLEAYRESVLNAIIHRDYLSQTFVRIEVFSNRIEILSPGGLPIGMKEEDFISGRYMLLRNELLAEVFHRIGYVEKLGTGIRRIKGSYHKYLEEPVFEVGENSICIILPKIKAEQERPFEYGSQEVSDHTSRLRETTGDYDLVEGVLNSQEEHILEYSKTHQLFKRKEIEMLLNIKKSRAALVLGGMVQRGTLIKLGEGKGTRYMKS